MQSETESGEPWGPMMTSYITTVKKRKLKLLGHVSRSAGLAKTILQGTVQCKEGEGEEDKRSAGKIISDWTGLRFLEPKTKSNGWKRLLGSWRPNSRNDYGKGTDEEITSFTNSWRRIREVRPP